jgi:Na+-transporting methylmalonyl-CoA/oxaloacetate decarboxylase gamma subunit
MKLKKTVLLCAVLSVLLGLTACSSGVEEVSFDYTESDIMYSTIYQASQIDNIDEAYRLYLEDQKEDNPMAEILLTGIANFDSAREDCGEFVGYRAEDGSVLKVDLTKLSTAQTQEEYNAAQAEIEEMISKVDSSIEEDNNGNVVVNLTAVYEDRDAQYSFVYEENPEAAYSYAISGQSASPYKVKEITVTPDYTTKEIMGKAGANTLMGIGTVFLVLIFISIIIGQFERVGKLADSVGNWWANRGNKKSEASDDVVSNDVVASVSSNAPMNDNELVAVITAAVVAANVANGGTDNLIVRSIRKARR